MSDSEIRIPKSAFTVLAAVFAGCSTTLPVGEVPQEAARIPERVRVIAIPNFVVRTGDAAWAGRAAAALSAELRRSGVRKWDIIDPSSIPPGGRIFPADVRNRSEAISAGAAVDADAVLFGEIDVAAIRQAGGTATSMVWRATLIDVRTREVFASVRFDVDSNRADGPPRTAEEMMPAATAEFVRRLERIAPRERIPLEATDDVFSEQAEEMIAQGRLDNAAEAYRAALRLRRRDAPAQYNLGVLAEHRGEFGEALEYFRAAADSDPGNDRYRQARDRAAARLR